MTDRLMMFVQFTVSVVIGCFVFTQFLDEPNPKVKYVVAFIAGVGAAWVLTYLINGFRHGFRGLKKVHF